MNARPRGGRAVAPMVEHIDRCLGCMACVTACPSGVQYDQLIEDTRAAGRAPRRRARRERALRRLRLRAVPPPRPPARARARAGAPHGAAARRRRGAPAAAPAWRALARLRAAARRAYGGCRARSQPRGERGAAPSRCCRAASSACSSATSTRPPRACSPPRASRCTRPRAPALLRRAPAARRRRGRRRRALARATIAALEGHDHVVVNAAGCGSAMKDYGHLLRDEPDWADRAEAFAAKVRDVHRAARRASSRARRAPPVPMRARLPRRLPPRPRAGRARRSRASCCAAIPALELLEPAEWEICCGSAGIYNLLQPEPAAELGRAQGRATCWPPAPRPSRPPTRAARSRSPPTRALRAARSMSAR